ncbi:MAG: MBG domain-containing protein, partial [Alphaproteobacteria bacterium]|nr:MBG domain-containing protein [Alphaproteobacteria bacterium]
TGGGYALTGYAGAFKGTTYTVAVTSAGAPASANAGSYGIIISGYTGLDGLTVTLNNGTLTVNPAALTVVADSLSKIYGDADPAFTYSVSGLVNGDAEASVMSGLLAREAGENVGTYAINQGTLSAGGNYTIAFTGGFLTINKYTLLVTADDKVKYINTPLPELTYTYGALRNGDTGSVFSGSLDTTATASSGYGSYPITRGTLSAGGNYDIKFVDGTLRVVTVDPNSAINRSKGSSRRGPVGTLLSIVNTGAVPSGALPNLAPAAGGPGMALADLAPAAGGNNFGPGTVTPLIQCNEVTPCDINQ